ncbi:hypothetical protein BWD41_21760 [Citrobacter braakii]|uniref:Uncharacterized protein n=2 Tax=Enterobacteriaceae TaxID=543 RepID=A0AA44RFC4_CITBR|nr:hypothetical protein BWD41_21760 [Citrobacter braakii]
MCAPMEQLNTLWRELGYIVVAEDEDSLIISKPFLHFPAGTPVSDIWTWFENSNNEFFVAQMLYGKPTH